jgi:uncharacterized protein YegL
MKKIDIICILDMSGSMSSIIEKAREGFNKFLIEQKESGNKIKFSLLFFDTSFYMPYKNVNIKMVKELNEDTYYANGGTSLYDALGTAIDNYLDDLSKTPREKRSDKTLFVILTDGEENSSRVYHKDLIKNMVTHMRNDFTYSMEFGKHHCEFIYLGANQDSCFQAESMGMSSSNAFNYDATDDGITVAYANIAKATSYYVNNDVKENLFQQ